MFMHSLCCVGSVRSFLAAARPCENPCSNNSIGIKKTKIRVLFQVTNRRIKVVEDLFLISPE